MNPDDLSEGQRVRVALTGQVAVVLRVDHASDLVYLTTPDNGGTFVARPHDLRPEAA